MRFSLLLASFLMLGCGREASLAPSQVKLDSFHSYALDGFIDQGVIETTSTEDGEIKEQIVEQLHYTVGHLNTWQGVGDLSRSLTKSIVISGREQVADRLWRIDYKASMTVSWSRSYQMPKAVELILPASTDSNLDMPHKFFQRYAVSECLDAATHDLGMGNVWYYLRPLQQGCELGFSGRLAPLSVRFPMRFQMSDINTTGHSPEYRKFWEDGRLIVTAVFSKNVAGQNPNDIGVIQYTNFYQLMQRSFGRPTRVSQRIPIRGPGLDESTLIVEFRSARGPIEIHMFLVDGMSGNGQEFDSAFGDATMHSDIVMYNGHAGLGSNVRGLARRMMVKPNQYQLFMLNGCDTFAYIDESIMQKHKEKNPESPDYKFVDIIANSMPSQFGYNAQTAANLIQLAVNSGATYRQILSYFDHSQHAVVFGEEDNN